jgi:hypothetical protein
LQRRSEVGRKETSRISEERMVTQEILAPQAVDETLDIEAMEPTREADAASAPFVGQWRKLESQTNWEKGRIIRQWRDAILRRGGQPDHYSDQTWAEQVGGVTAGHVRRLRRVSERFEETQGTYPSLHWSHFLAALDWDDAELWLEGAERSDWSVVGMRQTRTESRGAQGMSGVVELERTEQATGTQPAQGGSGGRYDEEAKPNNIEAGPVMEGPDFGDSSDAAPWEDDDDREDFEPVSSRASTIKAFADLGDMPEDVSEALEQFKLAILRHKSNQWSDVSQETVLKAIDGLRLLASRSDMG